MPTAVLSATIGGMKLYLHAIGCRLNQSEIETMGRQLLAAGHTLVSDPAQADKVIVNTCAVTAAAARDGRAFTRRVHRQNPDAEILLTGCYATIAADELTQAAGAGRIVANAQKSQIAQLIDPDVTPHTAVYDQEPILRQFLAGAMGRTRAFIKVQDGCNNRCAFCVTTIARGAGQSRPLAEVTAEIQAMTAAGYQEAVLTGVHLGSYGRDLNHKTDLRRLIAAVLTDTDIPRLRLSSLEPWQIADGFFELWQSRRLLPHLHLPLQSGSDHILRRMARRASRASFRRIVQEARAHIPDLNLTTDIIVGFPGETEADFGDSLDFVREIRFSRLHVFPYSIRPGTAAAAMPGQIPGPVKKERARRTIQLGQRLSLDFHRQMETQTRPVLWEAAVGADADGLRWAGYTDNYVRVLAHGPADLFNRVIPARLLNAAPDSMRGELVLKDEG